MKLKERPDRTATGPMTRARFRLLRKGTTPMPESGEPPRAVLRDKLVKFRPPKTVVTERTPREQRRIHRRIYGRMALIIAGTFLAYGLWLACWPAFLGSQRRLRPARRVVLKAWGRAMLRIVHADLTVEGTAPKPPFFLVSNHLSYIDIFVLAAQTGCVFVARSDMAHWPVMGFMMRTAQQLFIARHQLRDAKRVIGLIAQVLEENDGLAVFAEAKCGRGDCVLPFKPSLFEPAMLTGQPVHCAALHYETPPGQSPAGDSVVWWRWEPLEEHLRRLLALPGFSATIRYAPAPVRGSDRKALAEASHSQVLSLFSPIAQGSLEELPPPEWLPANLR